MDGAAPPPPRVLAIVGPTASGKSAIALAVARRLGAELVIADPFQRYRGLEIAADSPSASERAAVVHHAVGDLSLRERSDVAGFAALAHGAIDGALAAGRVPIVSGGTGLYVRAALAEFAFAPEPPAAVRDAAEADAARDITAAWRELTATAPAHAATVADPANPRRVARALALARAGLAPAERDRLWTEETRHPTMIVALSRPRAELDRLIALRVRRELDDGLMAELASALATPGLAREPTQIIGMRELRALRDGRLAPEDLAAALATRTRRLARKQLTWLRKTPGLMPLALEGESPEEAATAVLRLWWDAGGAAAPEAASV